MSLWGPAGIFWNIHPKKSLSSFSFPPSVLAWDLHLLTPVLAWDSLTHSRNNQLIFLESIWNIMLSEWNIWYCLKFKFCTNIANNSLGTMAIFQYIMYDKIWGQDFEYILLINKPSSGLSFNTLFLFSLPDSIESILFFWFFKMNHNGCHIFN